jgi:hypothetical protein
LRQRGVERRVLSIPPRQACPDELLVEAPTIRLPHLTDQPTVAVGRGHDNRHVTVKRQVTRKLARLCAKGLGLLGGIDAMQPHLHAFAFAQHADGGSGSSETKTYIILTRSFPVG